MRCLGRLTAAALAFALPLLTYTAAANASRVPSAKEREAVLDAGNGRVSCYGGEPPYPADTCFLKVRISTARKGWAAVYVRPTRKGRGTVQPDVATVKKVRGRWRISQVGNGGGCGVPAAVRRDLKVACY